MLQKRVQTSLALLVAGTSFLFVPSACSDSESGTTGKRIALHTRLTAGNEANAPFENSAGWTISLSKLVISTGAFYYFDGSPLASNTKSPRSFTFGIRSAFAHPGHYIAGNAKGEMLTPFSVDLLAGVATLPDGNGVSGIVRSATFWFNAPPVGALASELGGHVVVLEGTATKAADRRDFRAEIDPADLLNTKSHSSVEGCPFTETNMDADGTVTVDIKLPVWFGQVEFDTVPASTDGKPVLIPHEAIARNELVRGMKAGAAYVFSYSTP